MIRINSYNKFAFGEEKSVRLSSAGTIPLSEADKYWLNCCDELRTIHDKKILEASPFYRRGEDRTGSISLGKTSLFAAIKKRLSRLLIK